VSGGVNALGNLRGKVDANNRLVVAIEGGGTGDVVGPASATDNAIARYDGTTGKLIQDSGITIADGASGTLAGTNSGDVALAGTPDYITISGQTITRGAIDLASDVTGDLPLANLAPASDASRLLGRGSAGGAGDYQELTLGAGLALTGTVLAVSGAGTGDVVGPASATDNAIARYDTTTGKLIQDSGITIADGASGTLAGSNSGDVSLAGTPDYITISGQTITRGAVDVTTDITGDLPFANFVPATAASKLVGRGSASGGGDYEEVTIGSGLTMTGTTLSATGGGSGDVVGPASATDNAFARYDTTTGKLIQDGVVVSDDTGNVTGILTVTLPNTGLHLLDTNASHDLIIAPGSNLSADRTLMITTGDADRTVTITGDATISGTTSGTNTGDVTLAGTPDYITISGQTITRGAVDLTAGADITGDLPLANLVQASGASVLLGRGSASGAGDFQEITLGTGLSMTNQVLASSVAAPALTLYYAVQGTTTSASAENFLATAFGSGALTLKDTLLVCLTVNSVTQGTANIRLVDAALNNLSGSINPLPAGTQQWMTAWLRPVLSSTTTIVNAPTNGVFDSGSPPTTYTLHVAWTAAPQIGFRHDGVTSGGTLHYSMAIYKLAGQ